MERQYDVEKTGRQVYIAADGTELQRKYVYGTAYEWDSLQSLARTLGMPLGKMLVTLAFAEIKRIRDSQYAPTLSYASQR